MFYSPEAIVEHAKDLFLSEEFGKAFSILRECMDEEEVDNDTLMKFLKGETGYKFDDKENISFDVSFIDPDYSQEVSEILENYDFLVKFDDELFQVEHSFDFDLSTVSGVNNSLVAFFKDNENQLIEFSKRIKYCSEINEILDHLGCYSFEKDSLVMYSNKQIFVFNKFDRAHFEEIVKVYDNPQDAGSAYVKAYF